MGWDLLSMIPEDDLKRVKSDHIKKYLKKPEKPAAAEKA